MPPDLNSLPPSYTASSSIFQSPPTSSLGENNTPQQPASPRSSISLAAAATMNAADISRRSSTSGQRLSPSVNRRLSESHRSATGSNTNLTDPSPRGFGDGSNGGDRHRLSMSNAFRTHSPTSIGGSPTIATGDPHHQRTPSIGEIHQELEQEQEAQVNRLLSMIRSQQSQLQEMQQSQNQQQNNSSSGTAIVDDSTPTSERSWSLPSVPPLTQTHRAPIPIAAARRGSRGSNHGISSGLGSQPESTMSSSIDISIPRAEGTGRRSSRDDGSFYQAETAMLSRENQMLKMRIRELERQVQELTASSAPTPSSRLSQSISSEDQSPQNLTIRTNTNPASRTAPQEQSDAEKP